MSSIARIIRSGFDIFTGHASAVLLTRNCGSYIYPRMILDIELTTVGARGDREVDAR